MTETTDGRRNNGRKPGTRLSESHKATLAAATSAAWSDPEKRERIRQGQLRRWAKLREEKAASEASTLVDASEPEEDAQ